MSMNAQEIRELNQEYAKAFGSMANYNRAYNDTHRKDSSTRLYANRTTMSVMGNYTQSRDEMYSMIQPSVSNGNIGIDSSIYSDIYNKLNNRMSLEDIVRKSINIETSTSDESFDRNKYVFEYFDRWYSVQPDYELTNLCHYVFITKPDLNILDSSGKLTDVCANVPQFKMMFDQSPHILRSLCQAPGNRPSGTTFIPMLVSRTHALQLPDLSINSNNLSQPYTGYLLPYATHAIASTTGGEFDITFREFNDLTIHKLFNTWITYIDGVTRNKWTPRLEYIDNSYGIVCDYMVSVYDIICAPDASTILFMVKYTGCLPQTAPNSNLSFNLGGGGQDHDLSIPFKYFHCDAMNPAILADFNINAGLDVDNPSDIPVAAPAIGDGVFNYCTSSGFVKRPFITFNKKTKMYMLRWEAI